MVVLFKKKTQVTNYKYHTNYKYQAFSNKLAVETLPRFSGCNE